MTLTDFLLARIAEDEAGTEERYPISDGHIEPIRVVVVAVPPSPRVLAECEAKRRIVEEHDMMPHHRWRDGELSGGVCMTCTAGGEYGDTNKDGTLNYCPTLRFLALPYAEHDDYQEEWRP